jgi:hypothetical protein
MTISKFDSETQTLYQNLDEESKAVFDRLHSANLKKSKKKSWSREEQSAYGTMEIFESIANPKLDTFKDIRLPWAYNRSSSYGNLNYKDLYAICPWICPYFLKPMDYRQGFNDFVINIFEKDAIKVAKKQWYKPSVQHIVPSAMGGPIDDINNLMIIPLRYNILLRDMIPEERYEMIRVLSSTAYKAKVEAAEKMFYKQKVWSVISSK